MATGVIGGAFSISSAAARPVVRHVRRPPPQAHRPGRDDARRPPSASRSPTAVFVADRQPTTCCGSAARGSGCSSPSTLLGSVAGQMRGIALSTCVTLLVPEDRRDRANGMVGTVTGVSFAITSVFSGLVIGDARAWAGRTTLSLVLTRRSRSPTCATIQHRRARARARPTVRRPRDRRPGRARGDPRRARADDADPAGRVQQPAGRRVHGADGRLRPRARVGRGVGPAVGRHQPGVHRRRPRRRPLRPRREPAAASSSPATS